MITKTVPISTKSTVKVKSVNEIQSVENKKKNPRSFLEIIPEQKEVPPSHKLQDHAYE